MCGEEKLHQLLNKTAEFISFYIYYHVISILNYIEKSNFNYQNNNIVAISC